MNDAFIKAGVVTMKHLTMLAGPNLNNVEAVAERLGVHSFRKVGQFLQGFRDLLTEEEKLRLKNWMEGCELPESTDLFPSMGVRPRMDEEDFQDLSGFFKNDVRFTVFNSVGGKIIYSFCVKVLNKGKLKNRIDTPWRKYLEVKDEIMPVWEAIYKPPLTKKVGDIQWRILHGIIVVNAFVSIINSEITDTCPFYNCRETISHCFLRCK